MTTLLGRLEGTVGARCALIAAFLHSVVPLQSAAIRDAETVAVVYNESLSESKALAEYYAEKRNIPDDLIFGLDLPQSVSISRDDFTEKLQRPLLDQFRSKDIFVFDSEIIPPTRDRVGRVVHQLKKSRIRYLVLCYGTPVRITPDPNLKEEGMEKIRIELRRNEAAVDSELATLGRDPGASTLYGVVANPFYGMTNAFDMKPERGALMVARLDGPSYEVAKGLVDKALVAEENGLWGRAYFDARGLAQGNYKKGDDWIKAAAAAAKRVGFETVIDEDPAVFPASFPLSHVALYAGWYEKDVAGAFVQPHFEFVPGAIAYHLHSFSAANIRVTDRHWVGPLLAAGATATMGCVYEPYLEGTPDVATFFTRLLFLGFSFGEAAYAAQQTLSWQTTVVGDPLYRPFGTPAQFLHQELTQKKSPLLQWSILLAINRHLFHGTAPENLVDNMAGDPTVRMSSVLSEKLGDLLVERQRTAEAIEAYQRVLKLDPSPQQKVRVFLTLGSQLSSADQEADALATYERLLAEVPEYPGLIEVYRLMLELAEGLDLETKIVEISEQIDRLSPPTTAAD